MIWKKFHTRRWFVLWIWCLLLFTIPKLIWLDSHARKRGRRHQPIYKLTRTRSRLPITTTTSNTTANWIRPSAHIGRCLRQSTVGIEFDGDWSSKKQDWTLAEWRAACVRPASQFAVLRVASCCIIAPSYISPGKSFSPRVSWCPPQPRAGWPRCVGEVGVCSPAHVRHLVVRQVSTAARSTQHADTKWRV